MFAYVFRGFFPERPLGVFFPERPLGQGSPCHAPGVWGLDPPGAGVGKPRRRMISGGVSLAVG